MLLANEYILQLMPESKPVQSKKRFKELRQKLQTDDDDCQASMITPPNSQTSSVDGFSIASNRTTHPFRVIEVDAVSAHSLSSLGRVGRILGGTTENLSKTIKEIEKSLSTSALSSSSQNSESIPSSKEVSKCPSTVTLALNESAQHEGQALQEPDVIASTKASTSAQKSSLPPLPSADHVPVAPPRRKKKIKTSNSNQSLMVSFLNNLQTK